MVEALNKDTQDLLGLTVKPNQGAQTLLEAVGYDVDNSFGPMKILMHTNNDSLISVGSESPIQPGSDFTVTLKQNMSIQDIKAINIDGILSFKAKGAQNVFGTIPNSAVIFECYNAMIGTVPIVMNSNKEYVQGKLALMNWAEIAPYADGLWLRQPKTPEETKDYSVDVLSSISRSLTRVDKSFSVPLFILAPFLDTIEQNALYTGDNQTISFSIRTNMPGQCMIRTRADNAAPDIMGYEIQNIGLCLQYARLDSVRNDLVIKNDFMYHPVVYSHVNKPNLLSTLNFDFNVNKNDRLQGLMLYACSSKLTSSAANAIAPDSLNSGDEIFGGTNGISNSLNLFPKIKYTQVEVDNGGDTFTFDSNIIAVMTNMQASQTANGSKYYPGGTVYEDNMRDIKCPVYIDLTRLPQDLVGSSAKSTSSLRVKVSIDMVNQLLGDAVSGAGYAASLQNNFSLHAFLEVKSSFHLSGGVYRKN